MWVSRHPLRHYVPQLSAKGEISTHVNNVCRLVYESIAIEGKETFFAGAFLLGAALACLGPATAAAAAAAEAILSDSVVDELFPAVFLGFLGPAALEAAAPELFLVLKTFLSASAFRSNSCVSLSRVLEQGISRYFMKMLSTYV